MLPIPIQLFLPRLPNRSDVPLTEARAKALCLEQTDGAEILFGARSVLKLAGAAYAPGLIRVVEARQAIARAIAHTSAHGAWGGALAENQVACPSRPAVACSSRL